MLLNYLKIAFRLLIRNKLISSINILGLAFALTGSLLIAIFVQDELSYDRYHPNADNIYRVTRNFLSSDGSENLHLGPIAPPFGPLIKNDFPDVVEVARTRGFYQNIELLEEDGTFKGNMAVENPYLAEPAIFKLFSIPIIAGDVSNALEKPLTMMVSEEVAQNFFGTLDVIGEQVKSSNNIFEITGVYESFPDQSHWHPDILVSFSTLNDDNIYGRERLETNWGNNNFSTYLLVNNEFDPERTVDQFPDFLDRHMSQSGSNVLPSSWTNLFLQPLTSIHLHSNLDYEIETNGSINNVYIMSAIGVFLMLIACFNFINLSTARATTRGKEVGLRKSIGAYKNQLIIQHLSESVVVAFLSFLLSIFFIYLSLPWLNDFTYKSIELVTFANLPSFLVIITIIIGVGVLAGIYPAFVISAFKPALILKGQNGSVKGSGGIRKALVVAQFSISIIMIIATMITFQQLNYLNDRDLGYAKDQVIRIDYDNSLDDRYETFYHELTKDPSVINASRSSIIPTGRLLDYQGSSVQQGDSMVTTEIVMKDVRIDEEYFDTYQIPIVSGRNFSKDIKSDDSLGFIINETAAQMVGWTNEEAIGQQVRNGSVTGSIIGVVKDFHFESLHEPIVPVIFHGEQMFNNISLLVSSTQMKQALTHIEQVSKQFMPQVPFEYGFLSEQYRDLYESEQSQNELFIIFAGLAIFIASMGLFGLAIFNTKQRSKEVSIRKVLGAPISSIIGLLSKEILLLVLIANLVAWPIAWYFMNRWLEVFAYHIEMSLLSYVMAGLLALVVTLLVVSSQTFKAALANPATILRND